VLFQSTKLNVFWLKICYQMFAQLHSMYISIPKGHCFLYLSSLFQLLCAEFTKTFLIYLCVDKTGYVVSGMGGGDYLG